MTLRRSSLLLATLALVALASGVRAQDEGGIRAPTQKDVDTFMQRTGGLELEDVVYRAQGRSFEEGVCRWTFDSGVFVPITAGRDDKRTVGVVFVGEGSMELRFHDRGDAWAFANRQVARGLAGPDDLAPVAHQEAPYRVAIDQGIFLSADPKVRKLLVGLDPVGSGVRIAEEELPEADLEWVVTGRRGKTRALLQAEDLLPERRRLLVKGGLDPVVMLARDRLLGEGLGVPDGELGFVADFSTASRYGAVLQAGPRVGSPADDQWLTCVRDGSGIEAFGQRQVVFSHGLDEEAIYKREDISGEAWPEGSPPARLRALQAETTATLDLGLDRVTLDAEVRSTLSFQALAPVQHVVLRLPQEEAIEGSFEVISFHTSTGLDLPTVPLTTEDLDLGYEAGPRASAAGPAEPDELDAPSYRVDPATVSLDGDPIVSQLMVDQTGERLDLVAVFPQPLAAGEQLVAELVWRATWPYANYSRSGTSLGTSSGFRSLLPQLLPHTAQSGWAFVTTASLPAVRRAPTLALSGDTLSQWTEEGRRYVKAAGVVAHRSGVAVGRWKDADLGGQPSLKLHMFPTDSWALEEYPQELRRALDFYEALVGPYPFGELEVYQGPLATAGPGKKPGYALAEVEHPMVTPTKEQQASRLFKEPRPDHITAARQVGIQYWTQLLTPDGVRHAWIGTVFPDAYATFYLKEVFGDRWYWQGMDFLRHSLEDRNERMDTLGVPQDQEFTAALTRASSERAQYDAAWRVYGLYVMTGMLPGELGWPDLLTGLSQFQSSHVGGLGRTEDLQAALEASSGRELDDFFDFWVDGGLIPRLHTTWSRNEQGAVHVCVESNLPFGQLKVPVAVADREGLRIEERGVHLVDGQGSVTVEARDEDVRVVLDPGGFVLTSSRRTKEVDLTACEALP